MTVYATYEQFSRLLPSTLFSSIDIALQVQALSDASAEADGYLDSQYQLPLVAWGFDLSTHVCEIAAYRLIMFRGFNPDSGHDQHFRMRYDDAIAWLTKVARGVVSPPGFVDSTGVSLASGGPSVITGAGSGAVSSGGVRGPNSYGRRPGRGF